MEIKRFLLLTAGLILITPNHTGAQRSNRDQSEIIEIMLKTAEQGDTYAQNWLGLAYIRGAMGRPDYAEAAKWFLRAAEQGSIDSQYRVGQMYIDGKGVRRDYIQACKWLILSASANGQSPISQKAKDLMDSITGEMSPVQMAEAQRLARNWESGYVQNISHSPLTGGSWGVTDPVVLVNPQPRYTDEARAAHVEGLVQAQCIIRKSGKADNCRIIRGLGYGLNESVIDTIIKRWRFKPGSYEGKPVDVTVIIETVFRLH
jgi:TonB family protein